MSSIPTSTIITFAFYLVAMIAVGLIFCKKAKSLDEYLIGGRGVGSWVTAFSAQASDMSGWLLMGLPGAIYLAGFGEAWTAIGLAIGTLLNWLIVAPRLRVYTAKNNDLSLASFFSHRFRDPSGFLRIFSAIIMLFFFTVYAGSGLVGAGKLFESMFHMDYKIAVIIGVAVILFYTALGGYLAVCWTDLFQGALMFIALVVVPVVAFRQIPDGTSISAAAAARNMKLEFFPEGFASILPIISCAVWGLGYFGQPHILARFMSVKNIKLLPRSTTIAMIWVVISLAAAVIIGLIAIPLFEDPAQIDSEKVFIYMVKNYCNGAVAGIFLAAILAAIMSTIDSQLLVASSTLVSDFYRHFLRKEASNHEYVWVSRGFVLLITIIAALLALFPNDSIFGIVKFAWGGFGAAFGPIILMSLYSRETTWKSAVAGMIAGTIVMLVWYFTGMGKYMYEILPGFIANFVVMFIVNCFVKQDNAEILAEFDSVLAEVKAGGITETQE